jgi:hypothetical protein
MGGGGNFAGEGWGGLKAWNDDVGMMMRWFSFLHSFYKRNFPRAWEEHTWLFTLLCFEIFALFLSFFVRTLHLTSCMSFFGEWNKLKKSFGRLENFWQKILALSENLEGFEELLRQTFALDEKLGGLENYCAKPLRLMKK